MSGNVFEWTNDWYSDSGYPSGTDNPTGVAPNFDPEVGDVIDNRVYRGGCWELVGQSSAIAAPQRYYALPDYRSYNLGFRVVH
jgi:formylglycine-generating enzyme required for sulfatase activity